MMLSRVYSLFFFTLVLPMIASATALPRGDRDKGDKRKGDQPADNSSGGGQCNTGPIQCCNQVGTVDSLGLADDFEAKGIVIDPFDAVIAVNCSPITIGGVGGNSCNAQPVCCNNNTYNGLVNVGCVVVNINL
ncbi:fungal hydrophobin-domain-containing protein [Crassisporium funariophilum]|nr:fungal hydrophobin-domain-containing protein [Crassisporium funariophilum]